jgi:hypothetical protein
MWCYPGGLSINLADLPELPNLPHVPDLPLLPDLATALGLATGGGEGKLRPPNYAKLVEIFTMRHILYYAGNAMTRKRMDSFFGCGNEGAANERRRGGEGMRGRKEAARLWGLNFYSLLLFCLPSDAFAQTWARAYGGGNLDGAYSVFKGEKQ